MKKSPYGQLVLWRTYLWQRSSSQKYLELLGRVAQSDFGETKHVTHYPFNTHFAWGNGGEREMLPKAKVGQN